MKLTKRIVDDLQLPATGQKFVWDSDLKGFGIRLTPGAKVYIVQARLQGGVERRVKIGAHGVLTVQEARKKAREALAEMGKGNDPVVEKKRKEAYVKTLRTLADDYIKAHTDLKPSSIADINKHVDRSFKQWRDRPVVSITRDKVAIKFRELTERSSSQANQAFRVLRALFNYARAAYRGNDEVIIVENPVDILSQTKVWNRVQPRSGRIPTNKIGAVWNELQALRTAPEQTTMSRTVADVACFLILTGARWNEAAQLTWNQVSLDERSWYLPDPKNRNAVKFPLSDVAIEILEARPQTIDYVFPGLTGEGYISDPRGIMSKISEVAGVHLTAHDMRRTFRAVAGECNIELWRTKLLMNHKLSGDITISAYTETSDLRYLAPEINKISEWIIQQGLFAGSDKIVPLKRTNEGGQS